MDEIEEIKRIQSGLPKPVEQDPENNYFFGPVGNEEFWEGMGL